MLVSGLQIYSGSYSEIQTVNVAATDDQTTDDAINSPGSPKLIAHSFTAASTVRGAIQCKCARRIDASKPGSVETKSEIIVTAENPETEFLAPKSK